MTFDMTISLGHAITIALTLGSLIGGVFAWRQQTAAVALKLDAVEAAVSARLTKLEDAIKATTDGLSLRIGHCETNIHTLELQLVRDYVSERALQSVLDRVTKQIEKLEDTMAATISHALAQPRPGSKG